MQEGSFTGLWTAVNLNLPTGTIFLDEIGDMPWVSRANCLGSADKEFTPGKLVALHTDVHNNRNQQGPEKLD